MSKKYKNKFAVDNLSFDVKAGKVTGFLGPNGAGKSTTMRLMLGLDNGLGTTTYDGRRLCDHKKPSKTVGALLEAKAYHPTRTVRQHLGVLAAAGGISENRINEVLDIVGLKDMSKMRPGKFSLGMSQRLGIAAAILGKPKYLLLDEPSNGLDPEGIAWLRKFLKDYANAGNGVLVSSHLLSEMSLMADEVIVIGKGRMIANTSIEKLLSNTGRAGVFIRTSSMSKLERILSHDDISYIEEGDGLVVYGTSTDKLGKLAHGANIPIFELSNVANSLEEAFLEITSNANEYIGKTKDEL